MKQKNKEYIEAVKKNDEARRLYRKARDQDEQTYQKALDNFDKAEKAASSKFNTQNQLNHRWTNNATFNKMVLPMYKTTDGHFTRVGFKKGGKPYKPEKD